MTASSPLPARILIPVANPMHGRGADPARRGDARPASTASSRRSASSRCPRACRCPRARRAPGTPAGCSRRCSTTPPTARRSTRSCASAGTPPRASSRPRPSRRPTSSSSAGAARHPTGRDGNGTDGLLADDRRGRPRRRRATSRSSSSAARREIKRILVPVRGGPHAELAIRFADAIARHHDATVVVLHLVPPGITLAVRAQAERALAAFVKQHLHGQGEARPARGPQRPQRDPARGREGRPRGHGRVGGARRRRRRDVPVRGAARGDRRARQADRSSSSRPARRSARTTFDQLAARAETLAAADRAAEEARAVPARVERWFGESNFHHAEFADLRRLVQLKEKQGVTISLVLPTLDEEETIGPIVRRRCARWSVACRCSTRSSSSTPRRPTGPARSPRPRAPASSSTPTCCRATARSAARARRSGSRCTRRAATSSSGPTRT